MKTRVFITEVNHEDLDEYQCTELLQLIMFGEVVYG